MDVFEDFEIAPRILGITADNASNNTTMLEEMEKYMLKSTLMLDFRFCGTKSNASLI
jgi:hypothetical protein